MFHRLPTKLAISDKVRTPTASIPSSLLNPPLANWADTQVSQFSLGLLFQSLSLHFLSFSSLQPPQSSIPLGSCFHPTDSGLFFLAQELERLGFVLCLCSFNAGTSAACVFSASSAIRHAFCWSRSFLSISWARSTSASLSFEVAPISYPRRRNHELYLLIFPSSTTCWGIFFVFGRFGGNTSSLFLRLWLGLII